MTLSEAVQQAAEEGRNVIGSDAKMHVFRS